MANLSPAKFVSQVRQEMEKVTWPTRRELIATTGSVLAMSAVAAVFFFVVDQVIAVAVRLVLGLGG